MVAYLRGIIETEQEKKEEGSIVGKAETTSDEQEKTKSDDSSPSTPSESPSHEFPPEEVRFQLVCLVNSSLHHYTNSEQS